MRGIALAGGLGSRLSPLSRVTNTLLHGISVSEPRQFVSSPGTYNKAETRRRWLPLWAGLLGAYWNAVAYGFVYGKGNQEFELPLVNWLLNPSLYRNDPLTNAFAHFPTIFWAVVAYLSHWFSTERILFTFFVLTKVLFFVALARLVAGVVKDNRLVVCIVLAIALSPLLDDFTPFGASDILNRVQTHTSLAIAVLLWAAVFLVEKRWLPAAILGASMTYLDALLVVYMLFAFASLAVFDWHERKKQVLLAGLLGAAIGLPWPFLLRGVFYQSFPKNYVEGLLAFYPLHLSVRSHDAYELICGAGLIAAALCMVLVAARAGLNRSRRLELLAGSFLLPVLLGGFFGEFLLTPQLARLQLLRADSFLELFAIVLIETYGANLLLSSQTMRPRTASLLAGIAILLPLSSWLELVWLLFIAMALWADGRGRFEQASYRLAGSRRIQAGGAVLVLIGIALAVRSGAAWGPVVEILLALTGSYLFIYAQAPALDNAARCRQIIALCAITFLTVALNAVPGPSSLWDPIVAPKGRDADWQEVQRWAKAHTAPDVQFLVPIFPGGFRVFSERSSWGEWRDGQAMYHFPPLVDEYRERMLALGYPWQPSWVGTETMIRINKRLSWDHLLALARKNHLGYIVQFRDVSYPVPPVFANHSYAVYAVSQ